MFPQEDGGREVEVQYNELASTENGSFDEAYDGNFCVWESLARSTKANLSVGDPKR